MVVTRSGSTEVRKGGGGAAGSGGGGHGSPVQGNSGSGSLSDTGDPLAPALAGAESATLGDSQTGAQGDPPATNSVTGTPNPQSTGAGQGGVITQTVR